jgi:hydroxymethylpyrimidine pyrophosphatase-like HAD family hydrolase
MNYKINKNNSYKMYKFLDFNIYICCFYDKIMYNMQKVILFNNYLNFELNIDSCDCSLDDGSIIIELNNASNLIFNYNNKIGSYNDQIIYQI